MITLLTTAYWPNLHYFYYVLHAESLVIEQHEHYQKQSYRNRTRILTANGPLDLSIPVQKKAAKEFTKDIAISYGDNWQMRHWRAIVSAYKNSPYFDYFEEDIRAFYTNRTELLLDYNSKQLDTLLKLLQLKKNITRSTDFHITGKGLLDGRATGSIKTNFAEDAKVAEALKQPYYQTFESKFPFHPNLSMLDLLFNKGLESLDYLSGK